MDSELSELGARTGIDWRGHVGIVEYKETKGVVAFFYRDAVHNRKKSEDAGRPIYEDVVMVRIGPPGERLNVVIRPATRVDQNRFPRSWAAFEKNTPQIPDGTRVEMLYPEKPSIGKTLVANGIHTIEQLAELSANAMDQVGMGAQKWVNDAKKYIADSEKGVTSVQMRRELELRDQTIATLEHKIELLTEALNKRDRDGGSEGSQGNSRVALNEAMIAEMVAAQLAKMNGGRPILPNGGAAAIDSQTAQINALSPTSEITSRTRKPRQKRIDAAE